MLSSYRSHVISRIEDCSVGKSPFHHIFIENIFPGELYGAIRRHMLSFKTGDNVQDRIQDNPAFKNRRFNLVSNTDDVVEHVRGIFSDPSVKQALLQKFFRSPPRELLRSLTIHEEFEYIFTEARRFQNIHIDIPPKFMSFVFYIPERPVDPFEEERNATILYDKSLKPHYHARYVANSVCIFAPHFCSYHGFDSTIPRDVLVMFYIHPAEFRKWRELRQKKKDEPPFTGLLDSIESKLRRYSLIEFGDDDARLLKERRECRVNAPQGRVLRDDQGNALPIAVQQT